MILRFILLVAAGCIAAVSSVSNAQDDAASQNTNPNDRTAGTSRLTSGEFFIAQSWTQEREHKRPYIISVPEGTGYTKLPVFIFLHGNGGNAQEAMRGFCRHRKSIALQYIMVFPQGYRESWNIVSERSKADDLGFIEAIVRKLAGFENVDSDRFTIMGSSNGAALVNQLMIESSLPNVRNYISGVSPLNVWQYDGKHFKAKGADNNYRVAVNPAKGKRLMNISGVKDEIVPYEGGHSTAIPAKDGKLAFVDAEESTFVWARHMGYEGTRLVEPTRVDGAVEVFSYLDGDVVHCKVNNEGHGAVHGIPEQALLDFLGVAQDVDEDIQELNEQTDEAIREQRRFKRLDVLTDEKIKLLRELKTLRASVVMAEKGIEDSEDNEQQIERLEKRLQESEVRMEVAQLKLEILERRMDLEQLAFEFQSEQNELADEADSLLKMLDAGNRLAERFTEVWLEEDEETAEEIERKLPSWSIDNRRTARSNLW